VSLCALALRIADAAGCLSVVETSAEQHSKKMDVLTTGVLAVLLQACLHQHQTKKMQ
jgi:hypothetical protein